MVEITPKALRFARLAAEQQPAFAGDPQIAIIQEEEAAFHRRPARQRTRCFADISEETAEFCVRAVRGLLAKPETFSTPEWDGNDYAFMRAVAQSLQDQISPSLARHF